VPELELLRADHAEAVLAFETANRAFFTRTISDRGDAYFESFSENHEALLADQEAGIRASYVLVGEDQAVLGRFNLRFVEDGVAELGYRMAQDASGRGVATATVRHLCSIAPSRHGVRSLRAATSRDNVASQRVLLNAGFTEVGPADPSDIGGKQGSWYERDLARPEVSPAHGSHLHLPAVTVTVLAFDDLDARTAYEIWRLRQDVFVIEQACPYPDLDGRDLEPGTRHVVLREAEELIGCARVLDDGEVWRIGRVVLAGPVRGRGLGDVLMEAALKICRGRDVVLDAQSPLAGWYGTYGFSVTGPEFLDDGIPHLPMRRVDGSGTASDQG
jgi:[ribosomal protein S5]-alanine N-acetyltransferase